jgi:hypothetical protein
VREELELELELELGAATRAARKLRSAPLDNRGRDAIAIAEKPVLGGVLAWEAHSNPGVALRTDTGPMLGQGKLSIRLQFHEHKDLIRYA